MKNIRKIVAASLAIISVLITNPITANASWKKNSIGWWYTEGNSYATGWRYINGNWYYFYPNGYMAENTYIDGYYVDNNGAWVHDISEVYTSWRKDSIGWWYSEGNSYATGWRYIDGNWYYFYPSGYMAENTYIDGHYINEYGVWDEEFTETEAENLVIEYLLNTGSYIPTFVICESIEGNEYVIHCYDIIYDDDFTHTATSGWYYVDKTDGSVRPMF